MPQKKNAAAPARKVVGGVTSAKRRAASSSKEEVRRRIFPVVGVGASAGGLEAFTQLLRHLPTDTGMAFVLVQHLAPQHESALALLLSRGTKMPVAEVQDGMRAEPNHIYVIPPNVNMAFSNGALHLIKRPEGPRHHMPINFFLNSLAAERGTSACGVILSGTGSDGTEGLMSIKAEGGITFAQDEASAKFHEMPQSAVAAGCVDFVSSPEGIARELAAIGRHPYLVPPALQEPKEAAAERGDTLHRILSLVQKATGIDYSQYRETTVKRRLDRRMLVLKIDKPEDYFRRLAQNPTEGATLSQEILISVTSFFRDPKTYTALKQRVFPRTVKRKDSKEAIRIWVPGCSTGEEVYSLAISLLEYLDDGAGSTRLQFFGTDVSEPGILKARAGAYAETIAADVSAQRLRKYFVKTERGYQISKTIRDLCIFAKQDLTRDPPFSNLDLISCRNVLIYFKPLLQKKIISVFHYALKPNGYLLLGSAENAGAGDLFSTLDRVNKIFEKKPAALRLPLAPPKAEAGMAKPGTTPAAEFEKADLQMEAQRILLRRHTPPGVIIDSDLQVRQFMGRTGAYLEPAPGEASLNLLRMVREGLAFDLRAMVQEAKKEDHFVRRERRQIKSNGGIELVNLEVAPLPGPSLKERYFMVVFEPVPQERESPAGHGKVKAGKGRARPANRETQELREALAKTRRYLETIVEEQEATNEEARAANEEILSSNEELQSTNEELETAKEELQSANEELSTLNEELENRNAELSTVNNDLVNLLSSVNIPVVILDEHLRIRRFTPTAEKIFNLIPTDVGRRISDLHHRLDVPNFAGIISEVMDTVSAREVEARDQDGHWYSMRVRPYKTIDNRIAGAVLALVDIHLLKSSLQSQEQLLSLIPDSVALCDLENKIVTWNPHCEALYGYTQAEAVGNPLTSLLKTVFPRPEAEIRKEFLDQGRWEGELIHTTKDGRQLTVSSNWTLLRAAMVEVNHDITERRRRERLLEESEQRYRSFFDHNVAGSFRATRDGQVLYCNDAFARLFGAASPEKTAGSSLKDLGLNAPDWESLDARLKEAPHVTGFEATLLRNDGTRSAVIVNASLIRGVEGESSIEGFMVDVTGPKQVEKALRDLTHRAVQVQDEERQRYGRQLHEGIGSLLVALNMNLSAALSAVTDTRASSSLAECLTIAKQALGEVRSLAYLLHPPLVHEFGPDTALRWYVEGFGERSGLKIQIDVPQPLGQIPPDVEEALFRILQESLSNIHRHSGSQKARVRVVRQPEEIDLEISDEGRGFDLASRGENQPPALGVLLMKERAQLAGGRLEVESAPGRGTTIKAVLPVDGNKR